MKPTYSSPHPPHSGELDTWKCTIHDVKFARLVFKQVKHEYAIVRVRFGLETKFAFVKQDYFWVGE